MIYCRALAMYLVAIYCAAVNFTCATSTSVGAEATGGCPSSLHFTLSPSVDRAGRCATWRPMISTHDACP